MYNTTTEPAAADRAVLRVIIVRNSARSGPAASTVVLRTSIRVRAHDRDRASAPSSRCPPLSVPRHDPDRVTRRLDPAHPARQDE
jgi:hypothetical protein